LIPNSILFSNPVVVKRQVEVGAAGEDK